MSSNNNTHNQGSNTNKSSQGSNNQGLGNQSSSDQYPQIPRSPSQESSKPTKGLPETADNQQKSQGFDAPMGKNAETQTKRGGMNQNQTGQTDSEDEDLDQESKGSKNKDDGMPPKGIGTR